MTISRVLMWSGIGLLSAGWLMADTIPPDGHLGLKSGGCCSIDVTGTGAIDFGGEVVSNNGGGIFNFNNETGHVITEFEVTLDFTNFNQSFACDTLLFEFCDIFITENNRNHTGTVSFLFHGIGNGGTASNTCDPTHHQFYCPDPANNFDDDPSGINGSGDFYIDLNDVEGVDGGGFAAGSTPFAAIPPGALGAVLATPEPGTFVLLLSAGGLMLAARKFSARR